MNIFEEKLKRSRFVRVPLPRYGRGWEVVNRLSAFRK
jgi:hypothetical protein